MEGLIYRSAKQSDTDPRDYVLSDESVDRYGEVIAAGGWDLSNFRNHPIALFNHNANAIVGKWENVRIEGRKLLGRLALAAEGTSATVDEVRRLWAQKMLRAVSVGFRPLEKEKLSEDADEYFGPFRYIKQELVEASLVAVPANPNALQVSRSFAMPANVTRQLFGKLAQIEDPPLSPRHSPASSPGLLPPGKKSMKLSDQIKTAQKELNDLRDKLTLLTTKEEDLSDQEEVELEELADAQTGRIAAVQKKLRNLQAAERALASATATADPPEPDGVGDNPLIRIRQPGAPEKRPFAVPKKKVEPADLLVRAGVVHFMARASQQPIERVMAALYGEDEPTATIVRAVTNPANTTTVGWAAELVDSVNADFLDRLLPDSIYRPLTNMGVRFTFGRAGSLKIPGRANTPKLAGAWVGEGAPKPVRRLQLITITLTPKKLAVISTFTEELAAHSVPAIEQVIRQAMADDTAETLDTYLIDNVAASAVRPAGLLNGVTPLTPNTTEPDPLAMVADFKALVGAIVANGGGRRIAILMNPIQGMGLNWAQSTTGEFIFNQAEAAARLNVTFLTSQTVPADTVIAIDAADLASATGDTPRFSISDQATIHEESDAPLPIVGGGGSPVTASPVRSLWQTDSIGIRLTLDVEWAMRRSGMVAYMEGVTW